MMRDGSDIAYETAMELFELAELLRASGDPDRQEEAEEAYRQAVGIKEEWFP
jgi:hypothetical protein